jgi:hypothetical protein
MFRDSSTGGSIIIEPLANKPSVQGVNEWLQETSSHTVAGAAINQEWIYLDGRSALKVMNRPSGLSGTENIYVVNGSRTFAIRISDTHNVSFYQLARQMLSTFRFSNF